MSAAVSKPDVFGFDCFRAFLRQQFDFLKIEKGHSLRSLAKDAGFLSPNYLALIVSGKRNLSLESADRLASALDLNSVESAFFINLVRFNQSKTAKARREHRGELLRSKQFNSVVPIRSKSAAYYSNWYYIAIRELVATKGFREDHDWIVRKLGGAITVREAKAALSDLQTLGLLARDSSGRLIQVDKLVTANDSITSSALKDFHVIMIGKAQEAMETLSSKERDISGITIPVNEEVFEKMRMMIIAFRRELLKLSAEASDSTDVVQVNFQLFPLTRPTSGGENES